jgi:Ger(x)C family germination protein
VLVLGEDLAKDEVLVRQVMDGLNRDFAISKKVEIVVAEGKAKDLIETKTKRQEVIEGTIFALVRNDKASARFKSQTLTDFIRSTDANGVALVPKAVSKKDEIKISGGALFKKYKFIGYIGELENRAISMVKGKVRRELVETDHNGVTLSYSITDLRASKNLITTEEGMKIRISIRTEGSLQEYILEDRPTINTDEVLNSMEKAVEKQLKKELEKTIEVLQQKYNADALGIAEYLSKFHPRVWKEVEKDWDTIFPNIDFEVSVDVKMRRRGFIQ